MEPIGASVAVEDSAATLKSCVGGAKMCKKWPLLLSKKDFSPFPAD